MKKLLISLIIILSFYEGQSQNMIFDGSFENYLFLPVGYSTTSYQINPIDTILGDILTNCLCHRPNNTDMIYPYDITKYSLCQGWFNAGYRNSQTGNYGTGDYFNKDVNPSTNFGWARYSDVPINLPNSKDKWDNPLIPYTPSNAFDGKGYIGLGLIRQGLNQSAYTEIASQTLNAEILKIF